MAGSTTRVGEVVAFDEPRGIGSVRDDDGELLAFHCTQNAGGSRTIAVGTRVRFTRTPGALGEWEAADLESVA